MFARILATAGSAKPVNEAEQLQRDVWEQIRTGNQQWDNYRPR